GHGAPIPPRSSCSTALAAPRGRRGSGSTRCGCAASSPTRRSCSGPPVSRCRSATTRTTDRRSCPACCWRSGPCARSRGSRSASTPSSGSDRRTTFTDAGAGPRLPASNLSGIDPELRRHAMSSERRSNEDMIGRAVIDDIDAILAITNTDVDEIVHAVEANSEAIFTWDYERTRAALSKLYEKAKTSQWNANDLPWDTPVNQVDVVEANRLQNE